MSIEESIHERFRIDIGDTMRFDVLGRTVQARVTSIRHVDWGDARNGGFMFVFRPGPLEQAPHTFIGFVKGPAGTAARARLQYELVARYPNVSAIDGREIMARIQTVIDNAVLGISIVGGIALLSGVLILIGAVAMTKYQRVYESAILRTLGASTRLLVDDAGARVPRIGPAGRTDRRRRRTRAELGRDAARPRHPVAAGPRPARRRRGPDDAAGGHDRRRREPRHPAEKAARDPEGRIDYTIRTPSAERRAPAKHTEENMVQHEIIGDDMQAVILSLGAGDEVRAEAGAMMYMTDAIEMDAKLEGGVLGGLKRKLLAGESFFITHFRANNGAGRVAFAGPYPGKIIKMDLNGQSLLCQKDSFLCAVGDMDLSIAFTKRIGAGFFGGEGFILQKMEGTGQLFIHSGGTVVPMQLAAGERLKVDTGCLVALDACVDYDIVRVGGIKTSLFGGEGLFFAALTGPGRVWLQTLPFSRLADRIHAAFKGDREDVKRDFGGALGTLGKMIGGD